MKPLERIFFQACLMKKDRLTIRNVVDIFTNFGFSHKQLWYYLEKWSNNYFYDYGVNLDLGWFCTEKFTGEYKVMYEAIKSKGKKVG